ncbi:MAG: hypothetical protein ACPLSN_03715 [Dictyoglomus turgidum]
MSEQATKTVKAVFTGIIKTKTPVYNSNPDSQGYTNKMVMVGYDNIGVYEVPVISPNTIRAMLRDNIALDILERVGYGSLDYQTLIFLTSGGTMDPKQKGKKDSETPENNSGGKKLRVINDAIDMFRRKNIIASLLGGACGLTIIPGKLICLPAWLMVLEVTGQQTDPSIGSIIEKIKNNRLTFVRKDDTKDWGFVYLSSEGIEELEKRELGTVINKQRKKDKKTADDEENPDNNDDSTKKEKRTATMLYKIEDYIPAGAKLKHMIIIPNATDEEIGAVYSALRRFAVNPQLGGYKSKGFGLLDMEYNLDIDTDHGVDILRVTEDGFSYTNNSYIQKYEQYLERLKLDDIVIPDVLRG